MSSFNLSVGGVELNIGAHLFEEKNCWPKAFFFCRGGKLVT